MAVYTVHQPPDPSADPIAEAEVLEFVKDGFSFTAALVPPIWLAANAAWVCLAGYMAASIALGALASGLDVSTHWIGLVAAALNIAVGFEAANCRRRSLESRGWTEIGTVTGRDLTDCERRFFDAWQPHATAQTHASLHGGHPTSLHTVSSHDGLAASLWRRLRGAEI